MPKKFFLRRDSSSEASPRLSHLVNPTTSSVKSIPTKPSEAAAFAAEYKASLTAKAKPKQQLSPRSRTRPQNASDRPPDYSVIDSSGTNRPAGTPHPSAAELSLRLHVAQTDPERQSLLPGRYPTHTTTTCGDIIFFSMIGVLITGLYALICIFGVVPVRTAPGYGHW
jgi:hypothetical protein